MNWKEEGVRHEFCNNIFMLKTYSPQGHLLSRGLTRDLVMQISSKLYLSWFVQVGFLKAKSFLYLLSFIVSSHNNVGTKRTWNFPKLRGSYDSLALTGAQLRVAPRLEGSVVCVGTVVCVCYFRRSLLTICSVLFFKKMYLYWVTYNEMHKS